MHPIEIDAILKLAKSALRSGRVPEAEGMYAKVLKEEPHCAEALHFLGLAAMTRGKMKESLALVRRSIELAPDRPDYHNNLATVLGRMNAPVEALGASQRAIDLKEDFAEAWSNKGVALEKLGRAEEAIAAYRRAIGAGDTATRGHEDAENSALTGIQNPALVNALANLGNALSRLGEHEEATRHLRDAAELRPRDGAARKNLGNALRRAGKPGEAVVAYRMATELNPRDADAFNNLGAALQESGKVAEAEEVLRQCLAIDRDHKDAHWNRGLALLSLGRWQEGWVEYEWRRHLREDLGQKRNFPQPVWQGSPVDGMHVLVLCEQGLGDTIQFIRYVPLLAARGARVTVECQGKLKPLLASLETQRGGEGGSGRAGDIKVIARGEALPNFDMHARLMTLPCIFGSTPEDVPNQVPYLSVDEKRVAEMRETLLSPCRSRAVANSAPFPVSPSPCLRDPFRVGLVWQGNTAHKGDRFRSIPLSMFAPLAQIDGLQLVSLQKGPGHEQIEQCKDSIHLLEWSDPTDMTAQALVDTAAMIKNLDLVIAVDTAVAHLAGAFDIPVWMATPLAADWRWLTEREDTRWYPTMRLFRQTKLGRWEDVIERMAEVLTEHVQGRSRIITAEQREALVLVP